MTSPDKYAAEMKIALELHRTGVVKEAASIYQTLLRQNPDSFDLQHYLGIALLQMKDLPQAILRLKAAIGINPQSAAAWCNLGVAYQMSGDLTEAVHAFDRAIDIKPDLAEPYGRKAGIVHMSGRLIEAVSAYEAALRVRPDHMLYNNYGAALRDLKRYAEALEAFGNALKMKPDYIAAMVNRGNTWRDMGQPSEAISDYDAVLSIHPDHADALTNKARAIEEMAGRQLTAELAEKTTDAFGKIVSYSNADQKNQSINAALIEYARAFAADPRAAELAHVRLHVMMKLSDWSEFSKVAEVLKKMRSGQSLVHPFTLVSLPATPEDQLMCAQQYCAKYYPTRPPIWKGEVYSHQKLRIAYLSSDFHNHATAYLMAGLFEKHSRDHFEWYAFSYGPAEVSPMRDRLKNAFDHFIDIKDIDDEAAAQIIKQHEIDILVDLKGYTQETRLGIMALRPAPVQMTYLGFPGTTAAPYIDYAIVDRYLVPPSSMRYYTEKLVFLPGSYQVNDNKREIAPRPTRAALGLPDDAFIFCSFNNNYKITPDMFDVWMNILKQTPGSILWMYKVAEAAEKNLKEEARQRGVDASRLVFAEHLPQAEHLARISCADLFLDTLPCNAHTTASDALWAGVPVLTVSGDTFAGRVAGSILTAADLPELIAPDLQTYEQWAVAWAKEPSALGMIRQKINETRHSMPLFDTATFALKIEKAFQSAYLRFQQGLKPDYIDITD